MSDILNYLLKDLSNEKRWEHLRKTTEETNRQLSSYTENKRLTSRTAMTYLNTSLLEKDRLAHELRRCGNVLKFGREKATGRLRLLNGYFCQKRLCALCSYRRSLKNFSQISQIIEQPEFKGMQWVFITLTMPNVKAEELHDAIIRMHSAMNKMTSTKTSAFCRAFRGWFRCTEITYNKESDTYHPHIHILACCDSDYFSKNNKHYFDNTDGHCELNKLWGKFLNKAEHKVIDKLVKIGDKSEHLALTKKSEKFTPIDWNSINKELNRNVEKGHEKYAPFCQIQSIQTKDHKKYVVSPDRIAEVSKYTVKPVEYIDNPKVLETYTKALTGTRCTAFGGLMLKVHKRLAMSDAEDDVFDDNVETLRDKIMNDPEWSIYLLRWNAGAKVYDIEARRDSRGNIATVDEGG